jgi:tetratricopeptide (TPR) repeat protein
MVRLQRSLLLLGLLVLPSAAAWAAAGDPASLLAEISGARLETSRAVTLKEVKIGAGLATLHLEDGVLIPASPVGGQTVEMVFLGKGRIEMDPPDPVEAGQLELFTGGARLDEEFKEAVLVVGVDAAVSSLLRRPAAQPDSETALKGEELYSTWKGKTERKQLNVEQGILLDALRDPAASGYFAAWFRGGERGDFLYLVEPDSQEQVTLGRFVPLEATEKEKRKILRRIQREQRKGRLIGIDMEDLGQWDTWISASLRNGEGKASPGAPTFEPKMYTLEVELADRDLRLSGKARIDLKPVIAGSRAAMLYLPADFEVRRVTDGQGADLFFHRSQSEVTVILPKAPTSGELATVVVEYQGKPVEKDWNLTTLLDTMGWYPHAGTLDRAVYDVTFRWPKSFDLVASGRRIDGGMGNDGRSWERRVLDLPSLGFSFEVGHFKFETAKAGHVDLRFAFGTGSALTGREVKEEIVKAVADSLAFYEEQFGPYPLNEMTLVTANRGFSQGMLGFITLSDYELMDLGMWNKFFGLPDRRLVIAHEVAHQWWGNQVGWTSYRDQWISEAMASYAALMYAQERLDNKLSGVDLTQGWQNELTGTLADGRPLESIGPVVLGARLFSSRSDSAYQAIVYKKGAVVLDMLARSLGEGVFPKVLRQIVKVAGNRTISTEDFLSLIERITSTNLKSFSEQFIYGTGLPEVLYSYRFEKNGSDWTVRGEARQQTPHRYRYKVVRTDRGTFDISRQTVQQIDVEESRLVVPVEIEVFDPKRGKSKAKNGANATVRGNLLLKGESTEIVIDGLQHEPKAFWLDRNARVFGRFFDENRHPKRMLIFQGVKAASSGKLEEAEAFYKKALETEEPQPDTGETVYYQNIQVARRIMNARIELARARLLLDQGKEKEAEDALDRAQRFYKDAEEFKVLQARLEVRRGDYQRAFQRLRKGLLRDGELDSTEGYVLLAIAAKATSHQVEFEEAVKEARENGADVSVLTGT